MTRLDVIKGSICLVVIVGIVALMVKYGGKPIEEMPIWVWWLLK